MGKICGLSASCFAVLKNMVTSAESQGGVTEQSIEAAIRGTEDGFAQLVAQEWIANPNIAVSGTCCLIGMIHQKTLFVANLGDSRVVLGSKVTGKAQYQEHQLSRDHNVNTNFQVRQQYFASRPNDIYPAGDPVLRIKGIIEISRSIGDLYMKDVRYNGERIPQEFRLQGDLDMPYLTADPEIYTHELTSGDSFLIFASDDFWRCLGNKEAVEIVGRHSRGKSAKRLAKAALKEAAKKRTLKLKDLERLSQAERREIHGDISVAVLWLDYNAVSSGTVSDPPISVNSPTAL